MRTRNCIHIGEKVMFDLCRNYKKNFIIKKGLVQKEVPVKRRKILYLRKSRSNGCQERQQQD